MGSVPLAIAWVGLAMCWSGLGLTWVRLVWPRAGLGSSNHALH